MKPNTGLVSGVIVIVLIVGLYGYLMFDALNAKQVDASQVAVSIPTLDEEALNDIRNKNINGNLPITVNSSDLDNPAPFLTR